VNISECLIRCLGRLLDAGRVRDIAGNASHIPSGLSKAVDSIGQNSRLNIDEHHFHARRREAAAEGQTDAARAASHECSLAGKLFHRRIVLNPEVPAGLSAPPVPEKRPRSRNEGFSPAATRLPRHCIAPFFRPE
jgi:hypothetical protein